MRHSISSFYTTPMVEYRISHKVFNLINDHLNLSELTFEGVPKNFFAHFIINASNSIVRSKTSEPSIHKKDKIINYWITLPFDKERMYDRVFFVEQVLGAISDLIVNNDLNRKKLFNIKSFVIERIHTNSDYDFFLKDDFDIDISDLID